MSKGKVRKWKEKFTQFGFTATHIVDLVKRPQCILCDVVFCNSNLKPSKLSKHFKNKHGVVEAGYNAETLKTERAHYNRKGTLPKMEFTSVEKPRFRASNKVAYRIAKAIKPHTLSEKIIKPYNFGRWCCQKVGTSCFVN